MELRRGCFNMPGTHLPLEPIPGIFRSSLRTSEAYLHSELRGTVQSELFQACRTYLDYGIRKAFCEGFCIVARIVPLPSSPRSVDRVDSR